MLPLLYTFAAACTPGAGGSFLGFPTWYKYLEGKQVAGKCTVVLNFPNDIGDIWDIGKILLAVVEILLRVGGLVAVVFVIYGGFRYLTSRGEPDNTKSALHTILNALIGLIITIIATAIVGFIARSLT